MDFWNENIETEYAIPETVVDVSIKVSRTEIPTDHIWKVSTQIQRLLPWFTTNPHCGVHSIHGAGSSNGWERPGQSEILYLSPRARLMLRLSNEHVDVVTQLLTNTVLDCGSFQIPLGKATIKTLFPHETLYCRYLLSDENSDEKQFMTQSATLLRKLGIQPKKLICGLIKKTQTTNDYLYSRSLLITDLTKDESIQLQHNGLGPYRAFGFGLFIPHKSIAPVFTQSESMSDN